MRRVRSWAALASMGLVVSGISAAGSIPAAGASTATAGSSYVAGSTTPAVERSKPEGKVSAGTAVSFDLALALRNASGAEAAVKAVSDPGSADFHRYLTDAQWEATYGPSQAEVNAAETWLSRHGFTVGAVPNDRLFVEAQGTAATTSSTVRRFVSPIAPCPYRRPSRRPSLEWLA